MGLLQVSVEAEPQPLAGQLPELAARSTPAPQQNVIGVNSNMESDLSVLVSALLTDSAIVCCVVLAFCFLRRQLPLVYSGKVETGEVQMETPEALFGWIRATVKLSLEEVQAASTLDHAMLIEFCRLCMQILAVLGLPMVLILCPLHAVVGGGTTDPLSRIGFANVALGSKLCYVHAVIVWVVVFVTMRLIYRAQEQIFMPKRFHWLRSMPRPRATTILVENIPDECCTDEKLRQYFANLFSPEKVLSAYVVKHTQRLVKLFQELDGAQALLKASLKQLKEGRQTPDAVQGYEEKVEELRDQVAAERGRIIELAADNSEQVCAKSGFVTFGSQRDAVLALQVQYKEDDEVLTTSIPPDPADVLYSDLQVGAQRQKVFTLLGIVAVVGLFFSFLPFVIGISAMTNLHHLQEAWPPMKTACTTFPALSVFLDGILGSLALTIFMDFLPTVLMLVFFNLFQLRSPTWAQHKLQQAYFWFLFIFVVLITAVGASLVETIGKIAASPGVMFQILAESLPVSTHFYMKYLVLQWVSFASELCRPAPMLKFLIFRAMYGEEQAKQYCEPEDQDYYGMGARSARISINMVVAIVFCSLSPLIIIIGFVDFALAHVFFQYLAVFAEVKKTDLGGAFWVSQLEHLQFALIVYILLMAGVLRERAGEDWVPFGLALLGLAIWIVCFANFKKALRWQTLPFEDFGASKQAEQEEFVSVSALASYIQPELSQGPAQEEAARKKVRPRWFWLKPVLRWFGMKKVAKKK